MNILEEEPSLGGGGSQPCSEKASAISTGARVLATTVVTDAIKTAHLSMGRGNLVAGTDERSVCDPKPSETKEGDVPPRSSSPGGIEKREWHTDRVGGVSPQPANPTDILRADFLTAVGNTISQTEPLGVPKINTEETSSSSEEESEPSIPTPRCHRRMSSIKRAEQAALSLSKPFTPSVAPAPSPADSVITSGSGIKAQRSRGDEWSFAEATGSAAAELVSSAVRVLDLGSMEKRISRLLVTTPTYPSGVGGQLTTSVLPILPSPDRKRQDRTSTAKKRRYRMIFDEERLTGQQPGVGIIVGEENGPVSPLCLEAVHAQDDRTLLIREIVVSADGNPDRLKFEGGGDSGGISGRGRSGQSIARIEEASTVPGGKGAAYRVLLQEKWEDDGPAEGGGNRELMAVTVGTHPTRMAAPREVRAVMLLPSKVGKGRETPRRQRPEDRDGGIPVWNCASASPPDGLWQAAADGRIRDTALELRNKPAVWSSTSNSFELDLLEAWRPGCIDSGPSPIIASQPAPETVQMVLALSEGDGSRSGSSTARNTVVGEGGGSGSSSARSRGGGNRIPSMQLVPLMGASSSLHKSERDGRGDTGDAGAGATGGSWKVAIAAPVPMLHGFCMAVIGLETGILGASVRLVNRFAQSKAEDEAADFLGFDEALTSTVEQHQKSLPSFRNESPTPAMEQPAPRISNDGRAYAAEDGIESIRDGGGRDKDNIDDDRGTAMMAAPEKLGGRDDRDRDEETPVVPSLALGVVSAARDSSSSTREKHTAVHDQGAGSSSRTAPPRLIGNNLSPVVPQTANPEDTTRSLTTKSATERSARGGGQRSGKGGSLPSRGGEGQSLGVAGPSGGSERNAASSWTVPVPVKRRMSVQVAAAVIVDKVYRNTYVCNLCLLTLVVSFVADLYPAAPSHNVPLSAALLWASCNVDSVRGLRSRSFAYCFSVTVLLSLFMDVDFLISALKAYALSMLDEEDDDLRRVIVGKNMHAFGRIVVGIVAMLKVLSWQGLLATSPQGVHALNLLWRRFKLFLPIWGSPRKLTKEVYNRVVALAWLHLLSALALIIMAGIGALGFSWAPQYASSQGAGAPLTAICFLKALMDLLVFAALFRNMDLALCLNVFGCLACFQSWHRAREERRRTRHGVTYPKIILEWDYIMLCSYVKIFDLIVGLWLWIGLGWSWSADRDYSERHSIRMLLVAITTVQTLTDVWSVFLGITVSLLVSQYLLRKEKSRGNALNAFGEGDDGDIEIARSLATGRLLASPPLSSDASTPGGGRGEVDKFSPSGSRHGEERDTQSSDKDSYSTGESDTENDAEEGEGRADDGKHHPSLQTQRTPLADVHFDTFAHATGTGGEGGATAAQMTGSQSPVGNGNPGGTAPIVSRRRSVFAPGGNRLVYKRAFSARSSSDESTIGGGDGVLLTPETISLDRSFVGSAEDFGKMWDTLSPCASFRCRIGRLPEVETVASHLRHQGFFVVAAGVVSDRTKIYACAKGIGLEPIFLAELVFQKEMHELAFMFKCQHERLTSRFVCHMHLRRVIGDHQAIA